MITKRMRGICGALVMIAVLFLVVGCVATHQARSVKPSGFLQDYSRLRPGTGGEALLTYTNPNVNFRQYKMIILDPIKVYPGVGDSFFRTISPADLQILVNYLDATIRKHLDKNFMFVTRPGPGVMRFRIALTEADSANVPIDVVSSVIPLGIAISALKHVAFGSGTGVGSASVEFEALDSQTDHRLIAVVDRRIGAKYTGEFNKFSKWRATRSAFDHWAERLKVRLAELQHPQSPQTR